MAIKIQRFHLIVDYPYDTEAKKLPDGGEEEGPSGFGVPLEKLTDKNSWIEEQVRESYKMNNFLEGDNPIFEKEEVLDADGNAEEIPFCEACKKQMKESDKKTYEAEGGTGWPGVCEDCAEED